MPTLRAATVKEALAAASALGIARLDAQMLLLHAIGRAPHDRAWLLAHDTDAMPADAAAVFDALCARRATGEPAAYLVGHKEFHGLLLDVDARVLVPRADTETLVDWALEVLGGELSGVDSPRVLDLGTGSGAIALAISQACTRTNAQAPRPALRMTAVDASADALSVARANALRLGLDVDFLQGDWLLGLGDAQFDLIVSNPPYVADDDAHLDALRHEPLSALTSGPDGLQDLRQIIEDAPRHLAPGGALLLEHGWDQAAAVRDLLAASGFENPVSRRDLAGIERCSGAFRPGLG